MWVKTPKTVISPIYGGAESDFTQDAVVEGQSNSPGF
jgi:hypothetical protein